MTQSTRSRIARPLTAVLCLAALVAVTGCSKDRHVFRSTELAQKSVAIVEAQTGESLWSKDIPAGQQLFLDFDRAGGGSEEYGFPNIPADSVRWEMWTLAARQKWNGAMKGGKRLDSGRQDLPGRPVIIDVDIIGSDQSALAR